MRENKRNGRTSTSPTSRRGLFSRVGPTERPKEERNEWGQLLFGGHGDGWIVPPNGRAIRNALACLRECEKRGHAPNGMVPASLGHGIMLFFHNFTLFALEFLNNGDIWVTFAELNPQELAKRAEKEDEPYYLEVLEALTPFMDRGIVESMPNRIENLVSWCLENKDGEIQRVVRLIRDVHLMRIRMPEFLHKLAPELQKPVDTVGEPE